MIHKVSIPVMSRLQTNNYPRQTRFETAGHFGIRSKPVLVLGRPARLRRDLDFPNSYGWEFAGVETPASLRAFGRRGLKPRPARPALSQDERQPATGQ